MGITEYDIGYFLDMIAVMHETEELISQAETIEDNAIQSRMMELVAIYYSKPFLGSKRAYQHKKNWSHKLDVEEIDLTKQERYIHDVAFDWRNGYIAHSDQSKREQNMKLKRRKDGQVVGFQRVSSYKGFPLFDFQLDTLKSNIAKIKSYLWSKIYAEQKVGR